MDTLALAQQDNACDEHTDRRAAGVDDDIAQLSAAPVDEELVELVACRIERTQRESKQQQTLAVTAQANLAALCSRELDARGFLPAEAG